MPAGNESQVVQMQDVGHVFPNGFEALKNTTLEVPGGSFCTLLGSSGSGKTTLLRIVAGLFKPTHGQIFIGKQDVTELPVQRRDIGFVFQNYALFPHLNAGQNIEYPLKIRGWDKSTRLRRVAEILELVELTEMSLRRVDELSGGQQQRIAIGRALAYRPKLLLLDEPMGALDRKLRHQLGSDLRRIQKQSGITAIYVTHDQDEAFLLSDTIAVMNRGTIVQCGRPDELYKAPASRFVAEFVGYANLLEAIVTKCTNDRIVVETPLGTMDLVSAERPDVGSKCVVSIRPENIAVRTCGDARSSQLNGTAAWRVVDRIFQGSRIQLTLEAEAKPRLLVEASNENAPEVGSAVSVAWDDGAPVLIAR